MRGGRERRKERSREKRREERGRGREGEGKRDISYTGSPFKCLHYLDIGQAKGKSLELYLGLSCG